MKRILAFLLSALMLLALAACGSSSPAPAATEAPAQQATEAPAAEQPAEAAPEATPSVPFAESNEFAFDLLDNFFSVSEAIVRFAGPVSGEPVWEDIMWDGLNFQISRSEPDAEGFVTYTISYDSTPIYLFGSWPADGTDFEIECTSNRLLPLDYYTGQYLIAENGSWEEGDYESPEYETLLPDGSLVTCRWNSSLHIRYAAQREDYYTRDDERTDVLIIRAPQDYDGLVLCLNMFETFRLSGERPEYWRNENPQYNYWHFLRVSDYLAQQGA